METINMTTTRNKTVGVVCEPQKSLLSCSEFYDLLERFCNGIVIDRPEYEDFLQRYFNDEEYIDIWRIPHVMMDALQRNMKFNRVFQHKEFRDTFHRFIADLYDFCIKECLLETRPAYQEASTSASDTAQHLRGRHRFLDELMTTFAQVLENIDNDSTIHHSGE